MLLQLLLCTTCLHRHACACGAFGCCKLDASLCCIIFSDQLNLGFQSLSWMCYCLLRFSRGSVQTILPSIKKLSIGHHCGSFGDQIKEFERHAANVQLEIERFKSRKRESEKKLQDFGSRLDNVKVTIM